MDNKQTVWILQLIRYLVFSKDYSRIKIVGKDPNQENTYSDMWVVNPSKKFDVIHINADDDRQRKFNHATYLSNYREIKKLVNSDDNSRMLDISVNEEATNYEEDNVAYIALKPQSEVSEEISIEFPDISKVIHDVNDPIKEVGKLSREIVMLSYSRERRSLNQDTTLSKVKCKTFIIPAIISVVVFLGIVILAKVFNTEAINTAIALGAYYKAFVTILGQYYRFITAGFVHISVFHLICNLLALSEVAILVEKKFGFGKSMIILLVSIIIGYIAEFAGGPNQVVVGLSGGIYGLFGAMIVIAIKDGSFKNPYYRRRFFTTLYVNALVSLLPNVSLIGHLSGLVTGAFLGVIMSSDISKFLRTNFAICSVIILLILGFFSYKNSDFTDFYYGTDVKVAEVYQRIGLKQFSQDIVNRTYNYYMERE